MMPMNLILELVTIFSRVIIVVLQMLFLVACSLYAIVKNNCHIRSYSLVLQWACVTLLLD
jgi:hypothetical protein